jgi:cold shock CspA family protein
MTPQARRVSRLRPARAPSERAPASNFVRLSEIAYFEHGTRQIARELREKRVRRGLVRAIVIREPSVGPKAFYLFTQEDFDNAVKRAVASTTRSLPARLRAELGLSRKRPLPTVAGQRVATTPSIVLRGGKVAAVVLSTARSDELRFDRDTGFETRGELQSAGRRRPGPPRAGEAGRAGTPKAAPRKSPSRKPGRVKWWSDEKGYGFITPDEGGGDLFVHHTAIPGSGVKSLSEGAKVRYDVEQGPKGPAAGTPTIRRTPHMDAPNHLPKQQGATFEIVVRLDDAPFAAGEGGDPFEIQAPPEVKVISVGVVLTATPHLAVVSDPFKYLDVERDRAQSESVSFTLEVGDPAAAGDAGVTAQFLYRGNPCGRVDRAWAWQNDNRKARLRNLSDQSQGTAKIYTGALPPDLSILITAPGKMAPGGDISESYQASVVTTLMDGFAKPVPRIWPVPAHANEFVRDRIKEFEAALKTPEQRRRALDAAGPVLWDAAPQAFKELLRKLVERGKPPRNIYIASDEPSLPWELMIPSWPDKRGVVADREPLGVEFAMARWIRDDSTPPPPRVLVRRSFVIAPAGSKLDATNEITFLRKELSGTRVKDTTVTGLDDYFGKNRASLLHFVCHGKTDQDDDVIFLGGDEPLTSREARRLTGLKKLCDRERPLVFVNACASGVINPALVGGSGFPKAFGDIGAKAVIAPLWSVEDVDASKIAVQIYKRALKKTAKPTIAEVIRDLRARAYAQKGSRYSYAAYVFYGDPWARLERVDR